jgi:hypothetical protein
VRETQWRSRLGWRVTGGKGMMVAWSSARPSMADTPTRGVAARKSERRSRGEPEKWRSVCGSSTRRSEDKGADTRRARGSNGDRALRMTATSRARGGHCGIPPNTWQTAVWVRWNTDLGRLQAELGHGPKSKIEAHITLYKTCLRVMVISVVD